MSISSVTGFHTHSHTGPINSKKTQKYTQRHMQTYTHTPKIQTNQHTQVLKYVADRKLSMAEVKR